MSTKKGRRRSQNRDPLTNLDAFCGSENNCKGKKKTTKNMKGAGKSPRRPLSEIQVSSARVSLPEIPVKVNESGHLVVDSVENKEIATQTTQPLVVTSEKSTQTDVSPEHKHSVNHRMVCDEEPPIEYWQVLAEQRRKALIEALDENKQLYEELEELKALIKDREKLEQEAMYFSFMYKLAAKD